MKVGEYVRTECGIAKIKSFETKNKEVIELDKDIMICNMDCYRNNCTINQIIKSSPNIIDLIEVGDYVNGSKVVRIEEHNEELYVYVQETEYCNACDEEENIYYKEDTIKSIVTKEMFESMEYKVEEKE